MAQWMPPGVGENQPYTGYTYSPFSYTPSPETPEQAETRRLRKDAGYVGVMMLVLTAAMNLTMVVVLVVLALMGVVDIQAMESDTFGFDNTTYLLLYGAVYAFAMAVPAIIVSLCFRRRQFPLSPAKRVAGDVAFFGVLGAMGVCMVANLFASYVSAFFQEFGASPPDYPDMMEPTLTSFLLNLLVIAVLPALLEELVFRGYVLQALRPYGDWFAIIVSALLFGLMHGNIEQIPFALVVGLALGWLCVYTNNIWLAVVVHFCNNALSVTLDYLGSRLDEQTASVFYMLTMLGIAVLGGLSVVMLVVRRRWLFVPTPRRSLLPVSRRVGVLCKTPTFVISLVVFLLLTVWSASL